MDTTRHLLKSIISVLTLLAIIIFQTPTSFAQPVSSVSIKPGLETFAMILPDGLWVVKNGEKSHIADGWIDEAAWSGDGRLLAYHVSAPGNSNETKVKIYDTHIGKSEELLRGHSLKWAPDANVLALQSDSSLNLYDFRGNSSDGWTHAIIYKSRLIKHLPPTRPQQFFVIPKEISVANLPGNIHSRGQVSPIHAIHVSDMKYNQDETWIGFIASPTAGISVDYNALCVLRNNGRVWRPIGNIAGYYSSDWRFSPSGRQVGFIAGDERWPFRHKQAVTTTLADGKSIVWTPASLYGINLVNKLQQKLTTPPPGYRDYRPQVRSGWLIWTRNNKERGDIWIADKSGKNAEILVQNTGGNRQREPIIVFPPQ